jgi:two-component sensor histidine kinase
MIKRIFLSISNSGVNEKQSVSFTDKLIVRNHLAFVCAFFSLFYLGYFLNNGLIMGSICISISILLFTLSIVFNHFCWFNISKGIIILVTNFSVLFTSILFGFNSGFHLYLLTSPLITFMLFESKQRVLIFFSILSYCINFFLLLILYNHNHLESAITPFNESNHMYLVNFTFTIFIIIILILYYSYNNLKVNSLLVANNESLALQKEDLKKEVVIRKKTEEELVSLLADKSLLISEINHRVKNNLAVISGLLELENAYVNDENSQRVIKDNINRIKTFALLYEQLYKDENTGKIDIKEFLIELDKNCTNAYGQNQKNVTYIYDININDLTIENALPLGLIINELVVDSIKHSSLSTEKGIIEIIIKYSEGKTVVIYNDSFKRDEHYKKMHKDSYSFILIGALSEQLISEYKFDLSNGINFKMTF